MAFARIVLRFVGLFFFAFGMWGLLAPIQFASMTEVHLGTPTAVTDGRAVYGGLELGFAVFLWLCARSETTIRAGLMAVVLIAGGLFVGRAIGLMLDASGSAITYQALGMELVFTVLAVTALSKTELMQ